MAEKAKSTVRDAEVAYFSALADSWWKPDGAFQPLHQLNEIRLDYLQTEIELHFARPADPSKPLKGYWVIDIGCGGGLLSEPLARLGADVAGIDASAEAIAAARAHAKDGGLAIDYACGGPEAFQDRAGRYDIAVAMEIVEHVSDVREFVSAAARLTRPGGLLAFSTLNRTVRSLVLGKVVAEYVLGWVPPGTHSWRQFVKPSELGAALRAAGCDLTGVQGIAYNPIRARFERTDDVSVNYMAVAVKRG